MIKLINRRLGKFLISEFDIYSLIKTLIVMCIIIAYFILYKG